MVQDRTEKRDAGYPVNDALVRKLEAAVRKHQSRIIAVLCQMVLADRDFAFCGGDDIADDAFMLCADGSPIWVEVRENLRAITKEGRIFYASFRDVTEEKRMQDELAANFEMEKKLRNEAIAANAAKSNFLSRISHVHVYSTESHQEICYN